LRRPEAGKIGLMAKIVVGVDGSETSKDALRWAIEEARLRDARVMALNAWQVPPVAPDFGPLPGAAVPYELVEMLPRLEEAARRVVEDAVQEVAGGSDVEVDAVAVEGPPARSLVDAARDADLVVVGSRGHGGFKGLLLGSVSLHVAQHAPCPTVICRHREEQED
jgi:nucleotide-binding universal stress UspA family protein